MKFLLVLSLLLPLASSAGASTRKPASRDEKVANRLKQDIREARLNLLLKMAEARQKNYVCDTDSYIGDLVDQAIRLDYDAAKLKATMRQHRVLQKELSTNLVIGLHLNGMGYENTFTPDQLTKAFLGTQVFHINAGADGNTKVLRFALSGVLKVRTLDIDTNKWSERDGTYRFTGGEGNAVEINDGERKATYKLKFIDQREVKLQGPDGEGDAYVSSQAECDA